MNGPNLMTGWLDQMEAELVLRKWFTVDVWFETWQFFDSPLMSGTPSCYWRDTPNNSVFVTEFLKQSTAGGFSYAKIHQPMKFPSNQLISPWDHHHVPRHGPWLPWLVGFPSQMNGSFPMLTWFEIVRSLMNHFISNHESSSSWWKKDGFLCVSLFQEKKIWSPVTPVLAPRPRGPVILVSWQHDGNMAMADSIRPYMP